MYGTIDFEETVELEKFPLSQASDFKRCTAGGQDLDSERVRQEGKRRFLSALFFMSFQNNSFPPAFCRISYENARHILSGDMVLHTVRNPHFYSRFMIQRIEFDHIIITYDLLFQFRAVISASVSPCCGPFMQRQQTAALLFRNTAAYLPDETSDIALASSDNTAQSIGQTFPDSYIPLSH